MFSFANFDCVQARPAEVCFCHLSQMILGAAGVDAFKYGVAATALRKRFSGLQRNRLLPSARKLTCSEHKAEHHGVRLISC
jgi:hypothetical protein